MRLQAALTPAVATLALKLDDLMAEFPGGVHGPVEDLAVQNHAAPDPRPQGYAGEAVHSLSGSYQVFSPRSGARVLRDIHWHVELRLEHGADRHISPKDIWGVNYHPGLRIRGTGNANPDAS